MATAPLKVDFPAALVALRAGKRVRRLAWAPTHHLQILWPAGGNAAPVIQRLGRAGRAVAGRACGSAGGGLGCGG